MEPVIVKNIRIGEGIPKVCVPIVGKTKEEILRDAKELVDIGVDLVEWRCDFYEHVMDFERVEEVLRELNEILREIPIIFTFRTAKEGGEKEIEDAEYRLLCYQVIESGLITLLDVEMYSGEDLVKSIVEKAHRHEVKVIGSNHDFYGTPGKNEIITRLQIMQHYGADIIKLAVMPQNTQDVLELLLATDEMVRCYAKVPVVTMSMSGMGVISRVAGETFGSAITFASGKQASAPGQLPIGELKHIMAVLHNVQ